MGGKTETIPFPKRRTGVINLTVPPTTRPTRVPPTRRLVLLKRWGNSLPQAPVEIHGRAGYPADKVTQDTQHTTHKTQEEQRQKAKSPAPIGATYQTSTGTTRRRLHHRCRRRKRRCRGNYPWGEDHLACWADDGRHAGWGEPLRVRRPHPPPAAFPGEQIAHLRVRISSEPKAGSRESTSVAPVLASHVINYTLRVVFVLLTKAHKPCQLYN